MSAPGRKLPLPRVSVIAFVYLTPMQHVYKAVPQRQARFHRYVRRNSSTQWQCHYPMFQMLGLLHWSVAPVTRTPVLPELLAVRPGDSRCTPSSTVRRGTIDCAPAATPYQRYRIFAAASLCRNPLISKCPPESERDTPAWPRDPSFSKSTPTSPSLSLSFHFPLV